MTVTERIGVDFARGQARSDGEGQRAMGDPLVELTLGRPFGVDLVWIVVADVSRMNYDIGLGDRSGGGRPLVPELVVFE